MLDPERHPVWLLALLAILAGCGEQPSPVQAGEDPGTSASVQPALLVETAPSRSFDRDAPELRPGVRTAIAETLAAALAEFDLQPDRSMSTLQDFFQQVEARQAERLEARGDLLRTAHP